MDVVSFRWSQRWGLPAACLSVLQRCGASVGSQESRGYGCCIVLLESALETACCVSECPSAMRGFGREPGVAWIWIARRFADASRTRSEFDV